MPSQDNNAPEVTPLHDKPPVLEGVDVHTFKPCRIRCQVLETSLSAAMVLEKLSTPRALPGL